MKGAEQLSVKPKAQVLITLDKKMRGRLEKLFPSHVCIWLDHAAENDLTVLNGRDVFCIGEQSVGDMLIGIAEKITDIPVDLPDSITTSDEAIAWAKKHKRPYTPKGSEGQEGTELDGANVDGDGFPLSAAVDAPDPSGLPSVLPPETHDEEEPDIGLRETDISLPPEWDAAGDERFSTWQKVYDPITPWPDPIWVGDGGAAPPRANLASIAPGPFVEYLLDQEIRLGVDPGLLLLPAIGAAATVADDSYRIQVRRNDTEWKERPCLWCVSIAESGSGKGPAQKAGGEGVLRVMNMEIRKTVIEQLKAHSIEMEKWRHEKDRAIKNGSAIPEEPQEPGDYQLITSETTTEGLRKPLQASNRGIGLWSEEITSWAADFDAYRAKGKGSDRERWLRAYDGGPYTINRVGGANGNGSGIVVIPNWSITVVGTTTPVNVAKIISGSDEDGLIQRMLICCAGTKTDGEDRAPNFEAKRHFEEILREIGKNQALSGESLKFGEKGHELRQHFETWRKGLMAVASSPAERSHYSKWEGTFPRLCLVYALIEFAANKQDPRGEIPTDCIVRAYKFMREWQYLHVKSFWSTYQRANKSTTLANVIMRLILRMVSDETVTQIGPSDFHKHIYRAYAEVPPNVRDDALRILQECNIIRDSGNRSRSRFTPIVWDLNPKIREVFADRIEDELKRAVAVREIIANNIKVAQERRAEA